ncbi:hypothetical protein C9374_006889 [Naegleria lovaniensis]|uniref:NAD-dependent epimerase/dehydratase domain-containing protein n=1 Tax=Naegleria lovaniensis TaxID=51637 RepID=A0AA88H2G3_NAELO|nr:uncharacterized protein C9374_006889 [Naegleria lovaniensis]KAG2393358.1 hypothetical protein C9374_006889 [Naegleria lovaniensis]
MQPGSVDRYFSPTSPSTGQPADFSYPLIPQDTKVVILGINSFISRHLAFQLLCKGYQVVGTVYVKSKPQTLEEETQEEEQFDRLSSVMPYLPYWKQLFSQNDQLQIVELNAPLHLIDSSVLKQVCEGTFCVYHTSCVSTPGTTAGEPTTEEQAEELYYKPTLDGMKKVLEVCEECSVNRVIVTSGVSTLFNPYNPPRSGIVSECDWNQSSKLSDPMGAYRISKVKAERFAWEFCRYLTSDHKIQLVTILPTFVLGPLLPIHLVKESTPTSTLGGIPILSILKQAAFEEQEKFRNLDQQAQMEDILSNMLTELTREEYTMDHVRKSLLSGSVLEIYRLLIAQQETPSIFNSLNVGFVDVRDVARCHLLALETKQAKGNRFICCHSTLPFIDTLQQIASEMSQTFHIEHVNSNLQNIEIESSSMMEQVTPMKKIDGSKAEKILGLKYTPLEQTIQDMIQSFIDWKLVRISRRGRMIISEATRLQESSMTTTTATPTVTETASSSRIGEGLSNRANEEKQEEDSLSSAVQGIHPQESTYNEPLKFNQMIEEEKEPSTTTTPLEENMLSSSTQSSETAAVPSDLSSSMEIHTTKTPPPSPQTTEINALKNNESVLDQQQESSSNIIATEKEQVHPAGGKGTSGETGSEQGSLVKTQPEEEEQKEKFTVIAETLYP